ncbi:LOW QUALITY PROTEIN: Natural cytotoxicity triggering receptor 3 ligand 1 [Plecturocebus cupreus]
MGLQSAWPQYPLLNGETWPPNRSINYNTLLQLTCSREGKWIQVPYEQIFFSLRDNPQLCKACNRCPTGPSPGLSPYLGLPVASPSTNADQVSSAPITQEESGKAEAAKAPQATRMPQLCPLQAVGGEFGPTKQIKVDLGNFSDDPNKYIDVLQGLGQSFESDWKDIMLLLSQTLTSNERADALAVAQEFGDIWYFSLAHEQMMPEEKARFPIGRQAVPSMDPCWDPDTEQGDWSRRHTPIDLHT